MRLDIMLDEYTKIFAKKLHNKPLNLEEKNLLFDPDYRFWALHLAERCTKKLNY